MNTVEACLYYPPPEGPHEKKINNHQLQMVYPNVKLKTRIVVVLTLLCATSLCAQIAPTTAPAATSSFSFEDLYTRLNAGTTGSERVFTEPATGPSAATMHTINQIMAKAPLLDAANGADATMVLGGKTFWGLLSGTWGTATGAMPNNGAVTYTPGTADQAVAAGYHNGAGKVSGDADLTASNIKNGVEIFGVPGTMVGGSSLKPGGTFSPGMRWYDNNDGTITDVTTGLVWVKNCNIAACCFTPVQLTQPAVGYYDDVFILVYRLQNGISGLTDGSVEGDWRIPTAKEMQHVSSGTEAASYSFPQLFTNIQGFTYWTITNSPNIQNVYCWNMESLTFTERAKRLVPNTCLVMPVRSGI